MPDGTGERHVEQPQVFRQPLGFREFHALLGFAEIQHRLERGAVVVKSLILRAVIGNKRQPDQRVLKPFGFVDRDDLHEVLVTFQTQLLAGCVAVRLGDPLCQPAHQRMFALRLSTRLLQQFTDMQNIRQPTLAAGGRQQVFGDLPGVHQRAQHRHHAARLPDRAVAVKFLNHLIPRPLIKIQRFDVVGG